MSKGGQDLRELRRTPMVSPDDWSENLKHRNEMLRETLPHREPMLLVDELVCWQRDDEYIVGRRQITEEHLGLEGHFPGDPVLPGTLLLEMLGQVGIVLFGLLLREEFGEQDFQVRATKVLGAHFVGEVRPGDTVDLLVRAVDYDTFLGECEAQAIVDGRVVAAMAGEVMVV